MYFVEFECSCCRKKTRVIGTLESPLSYFYLVAHNRGFHSYMEDLILCPHCYSVFKRINNLKND